MEPTLKCKSIQGEFSMIQVHMGLFQDSVWGGVNGLTENLRGSNKNAYTILTCQLVNSKGGGGGGCGNLVLIQAEGDLDIH